jgi:ribosomal protein S6--L-glutamate ligase
MPPTIITESVEEALAAVEAYGEAVFKPLYTSKARGMRVIRSGPPAAAEIAEYKADNTLLYIQQKIDLPGQDLGVVFLGGEYLTTYARSNADSVANGETWNTTTRSGGKYRPYEPPAGIVALAQKAQDLFGLDFTCVDVVETERGPLVFEVSAFGGFRGIQTTSDIDPARRYVDYVMKRIGS